MSLKQQFSSLWRQSIAQLAAIQLAVLLCVMAGMLVVLHWSMSADLRSTARSLRQRELAELSALYDSGGWPAVKLVVTHTMQSKEERAVRITDGSGKTFHEVLTGEMSRVDWLEHYPFFVERGKVKWTEGELPSTGESFKILRAMLNDGKFLWLVETERSAAATAAANTWRLAVLGTIISLLGVGPVLWFAHRVHDPLTRLQQKTDELQQGSDYATIRARHAIPELSALSQSMSGALNARVDRIATLSGELNSVNEHLAHELKTPLARIRGDLEDLLDNYGQPDGEDAAVRGMDEIDRASQLVQTILAIRLGDTGSMRLHLEMTSPQQMIEELMDLYIPAAEDRNQRLTFVVEQDALVLLDRHRVRQAIVNLMDNALAYTPEGGSVRLVQSVDAEGWLLRVLDTGPGLTEDDLERIWKRFARGSAASARTPGTGLGLSLVKAVSRAHYGAAGAQNRSQGGSEFWLRLPLTPYPV
jgi:signal transduction histidine kinase